MVKSELTRNSEMASAGVSNEVRALTNLQNIKHSLKSDLSDQQICDFLFSNLTFTDKLIEEHLNSTSSEAGNFLTRDAESYREFINDLRR